MATTLADLRRMTISQSLFPPTTIKRALSLMGFVQADPIRAPARAQDLILRHRVTNYRAGDLERRYPQLGIEEDFFVNYGFVTRSLQALMQPRVEPSTAGRRKKVKLLLDFIRERGPVHPRDVDAHFDHGTVTNYWGGSSSATTHLLEAMHYRGLLRVARRESGIRIYDIHQHEPGPANKTERIRRLDALIDAAVGIYAPLPLPTLRFLVRRMRLTAPQWQHEISDALQRAKQRLEHIRIDGIDWYWPADADFRLNEPQEKVRLLAPFDPIVWDRLRFELLWGWTYRFEAYTPAAKRVRGYYALPMLWRDHVIGWANLSIINGALQPEFGYTDSGCPRDRTFRRELEEELARLHVFLGL